MPGTDIYGQGIAAALLSDKPDAQALAKALADGAAKYGVKVFANASNRGAVLTGGSAPTVGMVTYLTAEDRIDYWSGSAWIPVTPGPWISLPYAANITANSGSPAYRLVNSAVELRGTLAHTDASPFDSSGTTLLATLPSGYRPPYYRYYPVATAWTFGITGRLEVDPSGNLTVLITFGSTGPNWVSLDGVRIAL
ncbi:hypothetical protein ACFRCG_39975 [Embleya sp. NPDC056575]|uniref:hypothetical protein n=1 Tax=unclassified Embleya TaxID=2699296 RepID=UPI0036ACCCB7